MDKTGPPEPSSKDTSFLIVPSKRWTPEHLEISKVKQTDDVLPDGIIDSKFLPADGDAEFERVAELFCTASRKELESARLEFIADTSNHFGPFSHDIAWVVDMDMRINSSAQRKILIELIRPIMYYINAGNKLLVEDL